MKDDEQQQGYNIIDAAEAIARGVRKGSRHLGRHKHWVSLGHNILWRSDGAVVNPLDLGSGKVYVARHPEAPGQLIGRFDHQGAACDGVEKAHPWSPESEETSRTSLEQLRDVLTEEGYRICTPWEAEPRANKVLGVVFSVTYPKDDTYRPLFHRRDLRRRPVATIYKDGRFCLFDTGTLEATDERITGSTEIAMKVVDSVLDAKGIILLNDPEE